MAGGAGLSEPATEERAAAYGVQALCPVGHKQKHSFLRKVLCITTVAACFHHQLCCLLYLCSSCWRRVEIPSA
jgi:hypothetical protein